MTRDEHRKACIEAMAIALAKQDGRVLERLTVMSGRNSYLDDATAAFDSLNGIARVVPIEATAGTLNAARNYFPDGLAAYEVLAEASDLTNGKEGKL